MKLLPITSHTQAEPLRSLPALAIDLGFAQHSASIGVSDHPGGLTFGQAIQAFGNWIWNHRSGEMVLILEAPLSASFSEDGNPVPRGPFETHHSEDGHASRRVWFENAGAGMSLAAVHFLREITRDAHDHPIHIHVVEGFCSRYEEPRPSDTQVANRLLEDWNANAILIQPQGHRCFSNLRLVTAAASELPPAILRLPDGLTSSTDH